MKRFGVFAAIVCAAAFVGGASGGTAKTDLSTRTGVVRYLVSHGIDPTGIAIQRGAHNYAGPSCPGRGWTCTRATRVVQISTGDNHFYCTPSHAGLIAPPNTCTIVQISTHETNEAFCIETSGDPVVSQNCTIQQQSTYGTNRAVIQQIVDVGPGTDEPAASRHLSALSALTAESATQTASVQQTSGAGLNLSNVTQEIHQRLNEVDASGSQVQEGHQSVVTSQTSDTGTNVSNVWQSLAQKAEATGVPAVTQLQNATNAGPNTDAQITQTSTLGRNVSRLNQKHSLTARTTHIATVNETQSSTTGGLNGHIDQSSPSMSQIDANQVEQQNEDADSAATSLTQNQMGPFACCSTQVSSPANIFTIKQSGVQNAGPGANQTNFGLGTCFTSGNCTVNQSYLQNGNLTTNGCGPASSCLIGIIRSGGETFTCSGEGCPPPTGSTFTLTVIPTGQNGDNDTVVSDPAGINCGPPANTSCSASFAPGTPVTLTALTACDFGNGTWTGVDSSDGNVASVTMNDNREVNADYGNAC